MNKKQRRGLYIVLILLLVVISSFTPAVASSAALESRISRLEAENAQLRAQVNRLETQVYGLGRPQPQVQISRQLPQPQASPRVGRQVTSADPMFDRLATLVIELKERVTKLEAQVTALRKKSP